MGSRNPPPTHPEGFGAVHFGDSTPEAAAHETQGTVSREEGQSKSVRFSPDDKGSRDTRVLLAREGSGVDYTMALEHDWDDDGEEELPRKPRRGRRKRRADVREVAEPDMKSLEHLRPNKEKKSQSDEDDSEPSPEELMRECFSLCGSLQEALQADVLQVTSRKDGDSQFSSVTTIGIMLSGTEIDNMVVGGSAYNTKELDKGDIILEVDATPVEVEQLHAALVGSDVPGSTVTLRVRCVCHLMDLRFILNVPKCNPSPGFNCYPGKPGLMKSRT